jgi:AcrR family transcriptional regulator
MGIVERKERQKESLRQDILDAAREILLAEGYAKLSMRRIAKRIEYSPTTIYIYFKNKDEILYHLCEESLERQFEAMNAAASNESSPGLRLRATLSAYIDFGLSEPDRYQIIYIANFSQYVSITSILKDGSFGNKLLELVRHRLNDVLVESGSALDPESAFQALWAHSHGIVSLLISCPDFPWVERDKLIETNIDISLKGLLR